MPRLIDRHLVRTLARSPFPRRSHAHGVIHDDDGQNQRDGKNEECTRSTACGNHHPAYSWPEWNWAYRPRPTSAPEKLAHDNQI